MRAHENYTPHVAVALGLSLAIFAAFQVYLLREPGRIAGVLAADKNQAVQAGAVLFGQNCLPCHGSQGEGDIGPALNDKTFLASTADDTIFSVISSGVPDTQMPAWNQSHGGPLTDQAVNQLVAFIRSWEPNALDRRAAALAGDPARGAKIFSSVCFICHGDNGAGTARAPALNDPTLLAQFDDSWFKDTISAGRPAQGMPTWGTVLSPQQIGDILALIDQWRAVANVVAPTATPAAGTQAATQTVRPSNPGGPGAALNLTGNVTAGQEVFVANCQKCHGPEGQGGVNNPGSDDGSVPPLNPIDSTLVNSEQPVFEFNLDLFIEHGSTPSGSSPQLTMPAWGDQKKLTDQQIADVMAYVISLNTAAGTPTPNGPAIARPSSPGGPGQALNLTGNATTGQDVFVANCQKCHGPQGQGGVNNPGSNDGTVPALNPIDSTLANSDPVMFAYNVDLFVEHGSTPGGSSPQLTMPAWGDQKKLADQQIADVIAYVITLNPTVPVTATQSVTATPGPTTSATTVSGPTPTGAAP
jgi:mono/diheme cytochrome c family protein